VDRPHYEASLLTEIGRVCLTTGELAGAAHALETVLERFAGTMNHNELADTRLVLARVRLAAGAWDTAAAEAEQALQLLARTGMPNEFEADAHALLAEVAQARGDWATACLEERARHAAYVRHFNHQADLRTRMFAV